MFTKKFIYQKSYRKAFEYFYGPISDYVILALLPSYLEREGSSLIYMVEDLIKISNHNESGFYLNEQKELIQMIESLKKEQKKVLLLGVSFALLDLAENFKINFPELIVMETGGMKGRRKELVREELHQIYREGFGVKSYLGSKPTLLNGEASICFSGKFSIENPRPFCK